MVKNPGADQAVANFIGAFPQGFPEGVSILPSPEEKAAVVVNTLGHLIFVHESVDYHPPDAREHAFWAWQDVSDDDMPYVTDGERIYVDLSTGRVREESFHEADDVIQGIVYALNGERLQVEDYALYIIGLVQESLEQHDPAAWVEDGRLVKHLNLGQYMSFKPMLEESK